MTAGGQVTDLKVRLHVLTVSYGVMCHSADLEISTQLNSSIIMRHYILNHVHVNGINGILAADT